ncbi:MAG TPA: SDR family oxidoreductase, partial [Patescibacteria group bacterium]|nr:SDR family oxidoreductase [Patescibacteria group bacterium]
ADFAKMFPAVASTVPSLSIGCLLGMTRIVGMECPGERSVFSSFEAKFSSVDGGENLIYEVSRWDERLNLASIAVSGPGISASISALLRPLPVHQPETDALRTHISGKPFSGQRALVVGGSRGLGETCARLLALGGASELCLTYSMGREDAEKVARSVSSYSKVSVTEYDVLAGTPPEGDFTHIYYFAAPRLRPNRGAFSAVLYQLYSSYFVEGMAALFQAAVRKHPVRFMQPSSIFVEKPEAWFLEYTAAKAASENLAQQLMTQHPSSMVLTPRFPRVTTDQTQNMPDCVPAADVLLPVLMQMSG